MPLILIRHPMVALSGHCYGRLELDVVPTVLQHATAQLRDWQHLPIWCSPALRCRQLAQTLSTDVSLVPALQELDFGQWEGVAWDDIPRAQLDAWAADLWDYPVGGAESVRQLQQRVQQAFGLAQTLARHQTLLWITHAGVIRTLLADLGQIAESERWHAPIAYATPYRVDC